MSVLSRFAESVRSVGMTWRLRRSCLLACSVVAADQALKFWARAALPPLTPGADSAFRLALSENAGISFGLFPGWGGAVAFVGFVALSALAFFTPPRFRAAFDGRGIGLALLWGGGVGNLLDRLLRGRVTDYLAISPALFPGGLSVNFADAALAVGGALLLTELFAAKEEDGS